jgi:hypothetical protein
LTKSEVKPVEKKVEVETVEKPVQRQNQVSMVREKPLTAKPMADRTKIDVAGNSGCDYYFGYLAERNVKHEGIPIRCLECPGSVDCMLSS